jgi:hypothetical protein
MLDDLQLSQSINSQVGQYAGSYCTSALVWRWRAFHRLLARLMNGALQEAL